MDTSHNIDRREALRRAAILLGGAISAPTLAAVLKGTDVAWAATAGDALETWAPRTLSAAQLELVASVADRIIPATDTPGGRAAGVHRFADALLTDYYPAADRDRFLAGLQGLDVRARRAHRKSFVQLTRKQQDALLTRLDGEAFPPKDMVAKTDKTLQPPPRDPVVGPGANSTGASPEKAVSDDEGMTDAIRSEMTSTWFWRRMKEITVVGYYTSQPGATRELRGPNPMGIWRGDLPYRRGDRAWA